MANLIPLPSLPSLAEFDPESHPLVMPNRITWDFALPPHLDQERLVLDANHLRRLQTLGSFSSNHVLAYNGEQTEYSYSLRGITGQGNGLAGRETVASKADPSKTLLHDPRIADPRLLANYFDSRISHSLNKPELTQRVVRRKQTGGFGAPKNDEAAWAGVLDDTLQQSMRTAAYKHLLGRARFSDKFDLGATSYFLTAAGLAAANHDPSNTALEMGFVTAFAALNVAAGSLRNRHRHGDAYLQHRRWSLFEGMQPDRYLALNALTHMNSLIRYRK